MNNGETGGVIRQRSLATDRIAEYDGVRALSVLAVMVMHGAYGRALTGGFLGVDVFFVLSGLLITRLLMAEHRSTGRIDPTAFYARRAFRILPPLLLCLAIALPLRSDPPGERMLVAAAAIGFVSNFVDAARLGNLAPLWSLAIEEQFYLAWPLIFILGIKRDWRLAAMIALAGILGSILVRAALAARGWHYGDIYMFTPARLDSIMTGCLLAITGPVIVERLRGMMVPVAWAGIIAVLLALVFAPLSETTLFPPAFTAFAFAAGALIIALPELPPGALLRSAFANRPAVYLGQRSYGLYLYHYPIFKFAEHFRVPHDTANFLLIFSAEIAAAILVAELSWRFVERPALALKRRFAWQPAAAPTARMP